MGVLNHQEYHIYIEHRNILYIRTYIRACQIPVTVGTYSSFHHYFNFGTFFIKHHNFHSEPGQKPTYIHMAYRTSGNGQEPTYIYTWHIEPVGMGRSQHIYTWHIHIFLYIHMHIKYTYVYINDVSWISMFMLLELNEPCLLVASLFKLKLVVPGGVPSAS